MTAAECPVCRARQRDSILCRHCLGEIVAALDLVMPHGGPLRAAASAAAKGRGDSRAEPPWERQRQSWQGVEAELTVTLSRAGVAAPSLASAPSASAPLPFDEGASKAAAHLRSVLAVWVIQVRELHGGTWPADTLVDMAAWLTERRDMIRYDLDSRQAHAAITGAVGRALRVIDRQRDEVITGTHVAELADTVDAYLTGREVRQVLAERGITVSGQRFANWLRRGRLAAATTDRGGRPLYRVRDVQTLALTCANGV